jgi:hypothetical protein
MKSQTVLPVILSILIILLVAVLERHSRWIAAITATMPLGAPLALWIVYASARGETGEVSSFSQNLFLGILPTMGFLFCAWMTARAGWRLGPILVTSYTAWGAGLLLLMVIKQFFGIV